MPGPAAKLISADWWFRDRSTGKTVIAQAPNPPLWIFLAAVVIRAMANDDSVLETGSGWVGVAALAWWSFDELARGANPWRRALGLGGLGYVVVRVASLTG